MKLTFIVLFFTMAIDAFAWDWKLPRFSRDEEPVGGLRAVWYCPSRNRGDMPEEREVEIYYDEFGELKVRPDIFGKSFNPIKVIKNIFNKSSSSDVDSCLQSFLATIPGSIAYYQETQCEGSTDLTCSRTGTDISLDIRKAIRASHFYKKYENDLDSVSNLLPESFQNRPQDPITVSEGTSNEGPRISTPTVTVTPLDNPDNGVATGFAREPARPDVRTEDNELARARLLDYMTDNFSRFSSLKNFAVHCPELGETTGINENYCRTTMQLNNNYLTRLSQLFSAVRGEHVSVKRVLDTFDCIPSSVSEFKDLEDILNALNRENDCGPLANVGDFKLFRKQYGSRYYTTGDYLLRKIAPNGYEATLSLDFRENGTGMTSQQMLDKVRGCLAGVNQALRGPGGENLTLRVLSPKEAEDILPRSERPKTGTINIRPPGIAVDALNFKTDIDCPTITHELLHHLGLCDEYKETRTNIVHGMTRSRAEAWSCRVVPSRTSIMKNHIEAFNAAVPQQFTCECQTEACSNVMKSNTPMAIASRKIMMTASMYSILGQYAQYCQNPMFLGTVNDLPELDKAYTDIQANAGTLTFQNRMIFPNHSGGFNISRRNVACHCPADDQSCPAAFAKAAEVMRSGAPADSCPLYTKQIGDKSVPQEGAETSISDSGFTIVTRPRMNSLLAPNHFDKILTGSCMISRSASFKKCSEYAYTAVDDPSCSNKPAECSDDNNFLGVQEQ